MEKWDKHFDKLVEKVVWHEHEIDSLPTYKLKRYGLKIKDPQNENKTKERYMKENLKDCTISWTDRMLWQIYKSKSVEESVKRRRLVTESVNTIQVTPKSYKGIFNVEGLMQSDHRPV